MIPSKQKKLMNSIWLINNLLLEIKYTKRTYTGDNQYDNSEVTASVSFYDLFASTGRRLVINRNLTFNIVFNIDSNLITWAPDQQDWDRGDFKIDF